MTGRGGGTLRSCVCVLQAWREGQKEEKTKVCRWTFEAFAIQAVVARHAGHAC